jgi:hypothetical protein
MCVIGLPPPLPGRRERGVVPNVRNVSEHQRRCAAPFMTSKTEWSAAAAGQACTRANTIARRCQLNSVELTFLAPLC